MSIQFPDAPFQGQSFVATNGVSYTYDNGGWIANSQSALDDRFVDLDGDTMTGDLTVPNLESAGDIQSTSQNGGPLAGFRNKLINGNFEINQRGSVFTLADNPSPQQQYTLDRWCASYAGISASVIQDKQTPGLADSRYGIRVSISNGGGGTSNYLTLSQKVEDCATLAGKSFTLSFIAKASAALSIGVEFTRSYGAGGSASDQALVTEKIDLTTSFTKYTITGTMPSIVGKTYGSDTGDLGVFFWMTAGTEYDSRTSSIGLQTGTIDIMDVQLEPGPVATPFEQRAIGTELALCQRYYFQTDDNIYAAAKDDSGTPAAFALMFPTTMRSVPTMTSIGGGNLATFSNIRSTNVSLIPPLPANYFSCVVSADAEL